MCHRVHSLRHRIRRGAGTRSRGRPPLHQSCSAWSCCVAIPGSLLASLVQRGSTDCEDDGAPPRPLGCEALPFAFVEVGCNARFCPRVVACGCVGCTGHKVGMQFSNEVIDVLDLIFASLVSEIPLRSCGAAQVGTVRMSSPNLASMNVHFVGPFTSCQSERLSNPVRLSQHLKFVLSRLCSEECLGVQAGWQG